MPEFSILSHLQECRKPGVCTVGGPARAILMQTSCCKVCWRRAKGGRMLGKEVGTQWFSASLSTDHYGNMKMVPKQRSNV